MITFKDLPNTETPVTAENLNSNFNELNANFSELSGLVDTNSTYSYDEIVVGKWVNGKPLYRKVMIFNDTISQSQTNEFPHGIENVNFIMIKNAYLMNHVVDLRNIYPLPVTLYESNTQTDFCAIKVDRKKIKFYTNGGWNTGWTKVVILEYTKTTD